MIRLPVSVGEAIDKWNILHIKRDFVKDSTKLKFIQDEIHSLDPDVSLILKNQQIKKLYVYLDYFNREIWDLCDKVRVSDVNTFHLQIVNSTHDQNQYSKWCADIIKYNDARFRVKHKINHWASSILKEQKNFGGNRIRVEICDGWVDQFEHIIRYLSMCYDEVLIINQNEKCINELFKDDLNIVIDNDPSTPYALQLYIHPDTLKSDLKNNLDISYDKIQSLFSAINK
jgi:hypothetical protein